MVRSTLGNPKAVQIIQMPQRKRRRRNPKHTFHTQQEAFTIMPFMIAPVLPGETLRLGMWQSRAVTAPIKNPLIGWWMEQYFFYVKHTDLDGREDFKSMMLDPTHDLSAYDAVTNGGSYHAGPGINWLQLCWERIVEIYFRDEGEDWLDHQIDNNPSVKVKGNSWMDSLIDATVMDEGGSPQDGTETLKELDVMQKNWEFLSKLQMTDQTYEQWLATYGVNTGDAELHHPELLRVNESWTYPSNTIDPTDGSPTSACSWSVAERLDKDRFFKYPGFIVGLQCFRPKVYLSNQVGNAVDMMDDAISWLPAIMRDDPATSIKELLSVTTAGAGSLQDNPTNGYWYDIKDLLLYGDQFLNMALTATDMGMVALPTAALEHRYVSDADTDALFVTADKEIECDGIVSLSIDGAIEETT